MLGGEIPRVVPYSLGADRVILDDVSRLGLHRRHAVHYGGMPDEALLLSVPKSAHHLAHWSWMDAKGIGHLYMVWREE